MDVLVLSAGLEPVRALAQSAGADPTFYSPAWSHLFEDLQALFTVAAILVGGAWAYAKFVWGRKYRPRLEPGVEGTLVQQGGDIYVVASCKVKNVGLSKIKINQQGSALGLSASILPASIAVLSVDWDRITSFPVFEEHEWIEPGESVYEERMFSIGGVDAGAIQLELMLTVKKITWRARRILQLSGAGITGQAVEVGARNQGGPS